MLEQIAHFNDLSDGLRAKLEKEMESFGKKVRFKFNVSNPNPDPEKYNGPVIWPFLYTLDPMTFNITDKEEKRPGKSKSKQIGMVSQVDEKGIPIKFNRVRVYGRHKGVLPFDLTNIEDQKHVMYMLLHPKLTGGMFSDPSKQQVFERIDDKKEALVSKERRNQKKLALNVASEMSTKELKEFASAMLWDENEDPDILRNMAEDLADNNPEMFNDLVASKSIEFRATVKRALDNQIIAYNPVEFKFMWVSNQQTITVLGEGLDGKSEVERLAEWLMTGGKQSEDVYKKIKGLSKV